jgi:uncharacterized protein YqfA (UPF0365 family)
VSILSLYVLLAQGSISLPAVFLSAAIAAIPVLVVLWVTYYYGTFWIQAYMSGADVRLVNLIGMSLRGVDPALIIKAKIMGKQAGLNIDREHGMTTERLEAHTLAGGNVPNVLRAIIAADRAGISLGFDRAAAMDLAGRDILDAVRTSVSPKVIDCPNPAFSDRDMLSAMAKNGIELLVRVRVTVRTNLDKLIGGATEETIIARVGQGIISAIASSNTHMEVLETPDRISKLVLAQGLDSSTAFEIVSIDSADIGIGKNIAARLQSDNAEAETLTAQAKAESRRAEAVAVEQEMKALVIYRRSQLILAEAAIPSALATALRAGQFHAELHSKRALRFRA